MARLSKGGYPYAAKNIQGLKEGATVLGFRRSQDFATPWTAQMHLVTAKRFHGSMKDCVWTLSRASQVNSFMSSDPSRNP